MNLQLPDLSRAGVGKFDLLNIPPAYDLRRWQEYLFQTNYQAYKLDSNHSCEKCSNTYVPNEEYQPDESDILDPYLWVYYPSRETLPRLLGEFTFSLFDVVRRSFYLENKDSDSVVFYESLFFPCQHCFDYETLRVIIEFASKKPSISEIISYYLFSEGKLVSETVIDRILDNQAELIRWLLPVGKLEGIKEAVMALKEEIDSGELDINPILDQIFSGGRLRWMNESNISIP